jgi:hypothetical protein
VRVQLFAVSDLDAPTAGPLVMAVHTPADLWDVAVCRAVEQRLSGRPEAARLLCCVSDAWAYADATVTVRRHIDATLQRIVSDCAARGKALSEPAAQFYAVAALHLLEALRTARVVHCGLSLDTLRVGNTDFSAADVWRADRSGGWYEKGLFAADFSRAIDLALYPADARAKLECASNAGSPFHIAQADALGVYALFAMTLPLAMTSGAAAQPKCARDPWSESAGKRERVRRVAAIASQEG